MGRIVEINMHLEWNPDVMPASAGRRVSRQLEDQIWRFIAQNTRLHNTGKYFLINSKLSFNDHPSALANIFLLPDHAFFQYYTPQDFMELFLKFESIVLAAFSAAGDSPWQTVINQRLLCDTFGCTKYLEYIADDNVYRCPDCSATYPLYSAA